MKKIFLYISLTFCAITSMSTHAAPLINGVAVHSELGQESFIGALFSTTLSTDADVILNAQEEKHIQVRILASRISSRRFKRMWIEGMAINANSKELAAQSQNMANFSNLLRVTLVKNDIFAIQRSKDSVKISLNGATLGEIEDPKFFDILLRTWIGEVPLSSTFRDELLVGGTLKPTLLSRFNQTTPSDARISAVASALSSTANRPAKKTVKSETNIKKIVPKPPKIVKPKIAPPVVKPRVKVEAPKPVVKAPPKKVVTVKPKPPAPKPKPKKAAPPAPVVESIELEFDDDDEVFTAESLLAQQLYIAKLKKWTYRELRYPEKSLDNNEQGTVRLTVTIKRDGKIKNINVAEAPKFTRLTKAAITAVEKSAPYPTVPDSVNGDLFTFPLPITFKIAD